MSDNIRPVENQIIAKEESFHPNPKSLETDILTDLIVDDDTIENVARNREMSTGTLKRIIRKAVKSLFKKLEG